MEINRSDHICFEFSSGTKLDMFILGRLWVGKFNFPRKNTASPSIMLILCPLRCTLRRLTHWHFIHSCMCLYPGLRLGGERGGGARGQHLGGGTRRRRVHLSGVLKWIKLSEVQQWLDNRFLSSYYPSYGPNVCLPLLSTYGISIRVV